MENGISQRLVRSFYLFVAVTFFFFIFQNNARSATHIAQSKALEAVPGELIVKIKDEKTGQRLQSNVLSGLSQALGDDAVVSIQPLKTDASLNVIRFKSDSLLKKAMRSLSSLADVQFSEPNYVLRALNVPNDPQFEQLYGLRNIGQADSSRQVGLPGADINVLPVWRDGFTGSRNVVVAVIDTGIQWDHPDLQANLYVNTNEIAGNNVDDDNNGFVDDVHGWNFVANNNNSGDDNNHGTHCAGTIGGVGNNGVGVAGVNWQVSLMPIKFLNSGGSGTLADAVDSINYATAMNVNVMSNSWGGGSYMQTMFDAITAARDAGILFVAAAGNSSNDNDSSPAYPASYPVDNVLAVAATDNQDNIADFSSYGQTQVHVAAPGVRVYSTVRGSGYDTFSGTSMATPHVAGAAALLRSIQPTWTYAQIKQRLIETSDPVRALKRKVAARGRLNVHNALTGFVPPSNEPDENLWQDEVQLTESFHPYEVDQEYEFEMTSPGARYIRVHFERIETEARYDFIEIVDSNGVVVETISGNHQNYMSEYVDGDRVTIRLVSDYSITGWGFRVDRIQSIH